MAIMEISVVPVGTAETSVSKYVAAMVKIAGKSGLKYELCPMGTVIEGNTDSLFSLANKMHKSIFDSGVKRAVTTIKIDDRRDKKAGMRQKKKSVEDKL